MMPEMPRQLVLDLPLDPRFGREDFLVSRSNEDALRLIERWPDWPDPLLHLQGPAGSGKSHLAAIWAARAAARIVPARAVDSGSVLDLASGNALVIEDVDDGPLDEAALFHLLNLARERGLPLLFTSARTLDVSRVATPDLLSRLRLAPSVGLGFPDDDLLRTVLVKLFGDRQLAVEAKVVAYLATRIERSLAAAGAVVAALDREALSRGRRVTRAIVAELVGGDSDSDLEEE
jgi:chromosomal replication initiation ATPase DnaA